MKGSDKLLTVLKQRDIETTLQKTFRKNGVEFRFTIDLLDNDVIDYEVWDLVENDRITIGFAFNWNVDDIIEMIDRYSNLYKANINSNKYEGD